MRSVFEARASTVLFRLAAATAESPGVFLLPANICPVVPLALLAAGQRFEFVDLDPETLCPDGARLRQRVGAAGLPAVTGLVYARSYGAPHDARRLFAELRKRCPRLLVIDDRCLSAPEPEAAGLDPQGADVVLFSTGHAKPVELGYGGFAHLADEVRYATLARRFEPAELERVTALYKRHIRARAPIYRDGRDPEQEAALSRIAWLDTRRPEPTWSEYADRVTAETARAEAHRTRINTVYRRCIPPSARLPEGYHGWRFQLRVARPERLHRRIVAAGAFASRHYFPAAVLFGGHPCPVAVALHARILNLFNDHRISEAEAERLGEIVQRHLHEEARAPRSPA